MKLTQRLITTITYAQTFPISAALLLSHRTLVALEGTRTLVTTGPVTSTVTDITGGLPFGRLLVRDGRLLVREVQSDGVVGMTGTETVVGGASDPAVVTAPRQ